MEQNQVDQSLKWGIIFSILWLAGIGSLYALIQGLRAKKAIALSEGKIVKPVKLGGVFFAGALALFGGFR